ncbi:choice-of-anchor P family protein [Actinomadura sp. WMMB 499]|uniref:choice-of-anchor P family protein n=1 Tax=Actinomadura sp. WMMB 499 TaxID=1219491 RepID=UPI00124792ED|nr:choice-of-anchor P family protein [Actinomadura sp. WMMB 499]QFG23510.1 hypothetical protein F7P10_22700 [Actinomadura sp. WMMB 499]
MRVSFRRLTTAGLLAAGLGAALAPALTAPALADQGSGSAYGLTLAGPLDIAPVPAVSSGGEQVEKSLLREKGNKFVQAEVLDVRASAARARSKVARLSVPSADLLASAVAAKCDGGRGSAHLADARVAGRRLDVTPPPNTRIPVKIEGVGDATLTLNKQRRMPDGRMNVTAMELTLPLTEPTTLSVASATCGRPAKTVEKKQPEAPAPTPVRRDLPVTG